MCSKEMTIEMGRVKIFAFVLLLVGVKDIECSADAMKYIASGFMKVLDQCKHELNISDHIIADLYHFWKQDYSLLNRDTGCAIICMSKKLDLLDSTGRLHHGNAQEFAVRHGATDDAASKIVVIIHECEKTHETDGDDCARVLEVAKCFRTGIHELSWTPKIDVIITEVLTEL